MVVDAALWIILAAMIVLIACGCVFTASPPGRRRDAFEHKAYRSH